jgi:hypothetical protein|nr:hypothetical protein [uncultured Neisseria sp.]
MDVVGIMLMWLVGIVFFPIIGYIVWKIYKYIRTLSIKMQRGIAILTIITPLILYMGMSQIVDKGYCIRDRKYFSEYSKEKMVNDAIILLINKGSDISLGGYKKNQDFSKNSETFDIANFKSFNDDCCHVYIGNINDGSGPVKYVYKFTGKFYGYVMLEYWQIRPNFKMYEEQKRVYQKIEKTRSYYGVSRCGEVFEIPSYLYF